MCRVVRENEGGTTEETCGYTCFVTLCIVAGTVIEIDVGEPSFGKPNRQGDERSKTWVGKE